MSTFNDQFADRRDRLKSLLCVGLDPEPGLMPDGKENLDGILEFHRNIIDATSDLAVAYKPNLAFFEVMGAKGWDLFEKTIRLIRDLAPGALIIADAKRGDIGNTAKKYARTFFETFDCDAVTVNPLMGPDTLEPFLEYRERGVIVLGLTSNPGASNYIASGEQPLYLKIASDVEALNHEFGNLWLVVGATNRSERIGEIRRAAPGVPFLVPGVGAQGGNVQDTISNAGLNILINASRSILYAEGYKNDVRKAAREAASALVHEFRTHIE